MLSASTYECTVTVILDISICKVEYYFYFYCCVSGFLLRKYVEIYSIYSSYNDRIIQISKGTLAIFMSLSKMKFKFKTQLYVLNSIKLLNKKFDY